MSIFFNNTYFQYWILPTDLQKCVFALEFAFSSAVSWRTDKTKHTLCDTNCFVTAVSVCSGCDIDIQLCGCFSITTHTHTGSRIPYQKMVTRFP